MKVVKFFFEKIISCRLTHLLKSDVGQVELFIVRLMVTPHHKDNLEPLGPQGAQRLRMVVALVPLAAVASLAHSLLLSEIKENQYIE